MEVIFPKHQEYDQATDPRIDYLVQAEALFKMYGVKAHIKYYPFYAQRYGGPAGYAEICLGAINHFRKPRWKGAGYPKVIAFKSTQTLFEGAKRLIMRKNPVD